MECDRYEVLHRVVRIANCTFADFPRSCKSILRYVTRAFSLEKASFLLIETDPSRFTRVMHAAGPEYFLSCRIRAEGTPEGEVLQRHKPRELAGTWYFPVTAGRQEVGVIAVEPPPEKPLGEPQYCILRIVCEELGRLCQYDRLQSAERQHLRQLTLLSELGQELNGARQVRDLLETATETLLRHSRISCAIVRPLYGGALLGRSCLRIAPAWEDLKPVFLDLEERYAAGRADRTDILFDHLPQGETAEHFPDLVAVVPLVFQERVLGTLTLFNGSPEGGVPLGTDPEGRDFLAAVGQQIGLALERVLSREKLENLSAENDRKLRETSLLYRISRAMHSTLRINELMHLILSAAVVPAGGGFERAMLFTVNERTRTLQGMLCVSRETAAHVLPSIGGSIAWDRPVITEQALEAQRRFPFCQRVKKQRLALSEENPLGRSALLGRVLFVPRPDVEPGAQHLAEALQLSSYAVSPLLGRDRILGVLVVDNPDTGEDIGADRRRFLELFASQAGAALENSMLLHRLETAHQDLRDTQERLIQGEKMAVLGEMAASVAHELRNPLVPIGGFADRLARQAVEGSREHEYASIISREARRMEEMLANILVFSKKQLLCFAECEAPTLLEGALHLEGEALANHNVQVLQEIESGLPPILCDEQKLRQVLINLITNARQAMDGGGTLTLRAFTSTLRGDPAVTLEVEDTGGGVPQEALLNIFNPFFTTKERGTGLGLSISHRIVEQHRGEIEVKNREFGAAFILRIPALATTAGKQASH